MIGKDTVNTIPPATLDAFRDHGKLRNSLTENIEAAQETMDSLPKAGISMKEVTDKLTRDGVKLFADAFDQLLAAVEKSSKSGITPRVSKQTYTLPQDLAASVKTATDDWRANGKVRRLWQRDATLWTGTDEANWLGWLDITEKQLAEHENLRKVAEDAKNSGFSDVLLLGMGGSSLCPEVLRMTYGKSAGYPELHVLDSTDPAQIKSFDDKIDPAKTLFIVSSKSGSTLEPNIFKQYFFERTKQAVGAEKAGSHFIAIYDPGAWLEQLLAESTGKQGKGIIPVDRETIGAPDLYGNDRVFAYLRLDSAPDAQQDAQVAALEKAGHPVVRIAVGDKYDLGQEFFRWEIATAVAGSILGINAFNQPDVEASKIATKSLTSEYEKSGSLPPEKPILEDKGVKLFTDEKNASDLAKAAGSDKSLAGYLKAHFGRIKAGDYFAVLGYIQMNEPHEKALQTIRHTLRDKKHVATCLGFGPRFLHSTGQAYKGGPNSGVFLQITCDDAKDLPVPGQKYTFGIVKAAQARGDFQVLAERGRRALRVHPGADVKTDLAKLNSIISRVLA